MGGERTSACQIPRLSQRDDIADFQKGQDLINLSAVLSGTEAVQFSVLAGSTYTNIDADNDGVFTMSIELRGLTSAIGWGDILG